MLGRTRRSRLLVLLLLLLSPGLGGWAVQALHPCPAEASHAAGDGGSDCASHPSPAHGGHGSDCHCFGSCHATPSFQPAGAPVVAAPIPSFALAIPRPAEPERPAASRLSPLHPPATAPPALS
jgi:hypothetical protein